VERGVLTKDPTRKWAVLAVIMGSLLAVLLGQGLLNALGSVTRASSEGVQVDGIGLLSADSVVYLELAASDAWPLDTPWNRSLYIALLRVGGLLGDATTFIVVVQILALVVAAALAFRTAQSIGGPVAGAIAAIVVAVNPLTAQWARFVLTETLFIGLMLTVLWATHQLLERVHRRHVPVVLVTATTLAALLRPNGIMVLGGALTLLVLERTHRRRGVLLLGVWTMVIVGLTAGLIAAGHPSERTITEQLHAGVVIEGAEHVVMTIAMPAPRDHEDTTLIAGLRYAVRHPIAVLRLALTRIIVEVAQARTHYPPPVNVAVGTAMVLLLGTALLGAREPAARSLRRAVVVLGAPILLLVGATFATPEGRYGWGALILLAPLAGVGTATLLRRIGVEA